MSASNGNGNGKPLEPLVFNEQAALERFSGDRELFRSVIQAFLRDMDRHLDRIREGFACENNVSAVIIEAYNIMGSSSNVGAETVCVFASDLEQAARKGHWGQALEALVRLERELGALKTVMRERGWL